MTWQAPPMELRRVLEPVYEWFLLRMMDGLRDERGPLQVTSWWRSPEWNAQVGGHPESQHLFGLAIDLAVENPRATADAMGFQGLHAVPYGSYVHVQLLPPGTLRRWGWFG